MHENWKQTEGSVTSVDWYPTRGGTWYTVVFNYKVDGEWYGGTLNTDEEYSKGDSITVVYDPTHPDRNNLVEQEKVRHWVIAAVVCAAGLLILFAFWH